MPYGVDKSLGGDSKENVAWMERCVKSVQEGGKDKSSAVAICKAQLRRKKSKSESLDTPVVIDNDILASFLTYRENYIRSSMASLDVNYETAKGMFLYHLAKKNYDIFR